MKLALTTILTLFSTLAVRAQDYKVMHADSYCFSYNTGQTAIFPFKKCDTQLTFYKSKLEILPSSGARMNFRFVKSRYSDTKTYAPYFLWEAVDSDGIFCSVELRYNTNKDNAAEVDIRYPGKKTHCNYRGIIISAL